MSLSERSLQSFIYFFFFFNDTATTEIYTLSLTRRSSDLSTLGTVLIRSRSNSRSSRSRTISMRSEEHTSELQSQSNLVCRLLLEKKKKKKIQVEKDYNQAN